MNVFTPEQMRAFDREAVEKFKIPSIVLMENAALRVVEFCEAKFAPIAGKRVLVACGKGNNGGDGFAIARHLSSSGCVVTVVLACKKSDLTGDALVNFEALPPSLPVLSTDAEWPVVDLIIDALLGTGFKGQLRRGPVMTALEKIQGLAVRRVAVDVPSGVDAGSGAAADCALRADYTVTFAAPKRGLLVREGLGLCGEIWVGGIGAPLMQSMDAQTGCEVLTRSRISFQAAFLKREPDTHKGDAGRVVIVGGSRGMSGAVALASRAALATGAGLCLAMVPDAILDTVAAGVLEATTWPLACDSDGALTEAAFDDIAAKWAKVQCVAVGPGIGRGPATLELVRRIVRECPQTLVIDADALYALRAIAADVKARKAPTILTPHPGEMAELLDSDTKAVQNDRYAAVRTCASRYNATVVLKGARTLVSIGELSWVNVTGNPGMATGGSGDVLTGTIASLCAGLRPAVAPNGEEGELLCAAMEAAQIGVYAHGLAGDIVYETKGYGLVASDIAACLPLALAKLQGYDIPDDEINPRLRRLH